MTPLKFTLARPHGDGKSGRQTDRQPCHGCCTGCH